MANTLFDPFHLTYALYALSPLTWNDVVSLIGHISLGDFLLWASFAFAATSLIGIKRWMFSPRAKLT